MKRTYWIVNQTDKPCERLITEERDGSLFYIHPEMREEWKDQPMSMSDATPLSDFGIQTKQGDGWLVGVCFPNRCTATYPDGKPRKWQGSRIFRFPYDPDFTFGAASQQGD